MNPDDALAEVERRLGIRFPGAYRDFIVERKRYDIAVKRVSLFPIERCDWLDDTRTAVAIGRSTIDGAETLCFKVKRGVASDAVYSWDGERFKRVPDFGELVVRERINPTLDTDERVRLAERLGGAARRCACGREIKVLQACECGRIGARKDPPYVLSDAEQHHAEQAFATLMRAARIVAALRQRGHAVPSGPTQLVAIADLLDAGAPAAALLASWKRTGMTIDLDEGALVRVLEDVR